MSEQERLRLAERVCVMYGWTGSPAHSKSTDREKALHELWVEWFRLHEAEEGPCRPKKHPDLSDDVVRHLAARRDEIVGRTMGRIATIIAVEPREG